MSKLIVVTGASSGIGLSFAKKYHELGYNLLLVARREERLKQTSEELNNLRSNSANYQVCDLANREQTKALALILSGQEICGLINNAGRGSMGPFSSSDIDDELSQIELNVNAPLILSRAILPKMIGRKEGFIISVSSIMAYQAAPFVATYAATKSFEWLHSVALSRELEDFGIKVLTLCPGPTDTEFFGIAKNSAKLGKFKRATAESVVNAAIKALNRGDRVCIPDLRARLMVLAAQIIPTSVYTYAVKFMLSKKY